MVHETRTANTVAEGIGNMVGAMKRDYLDWSGGRNDSIDAEFCDGFRVSAGTKYARVFNRNSVTAFVVLVDNDKKFRLGDILKPAGYSAPARNGARGNVLDGGYHINWTGPLYLKG
tara:strand:- start:459 stop:806 length:348 start_codon:yes stop_codon:yes gene_type:complete